MAIVLNINGVAKTNQVDWESIQKTSVVTKEPDTLSFIIRNYGTKTYQPALNDVVQLLNGATKYFEGLVVETEEVIEGLAKYYRVTCKDYTQYLDRKLVSKVYTNQTANAIISDLISTFTSGFTVTNVVAPVTIPSVVFNYVTVSQALEKLTQMLGNYQWYVDYDKDIHFFVSTTQAAAFNLTDTSQNYVYGSVELDSDSHQIRNEIIIRGGNFTSSTLRTEYFDGDGTKTSFPLTAKYSSTPTITVGGSGKTVGIDGTDPDASYQWMWDKNNNSIRSTSGNTAGAGTRNIVVTGYPLYPLIFRKTSAASITLYGLYQFLINDTTITTVGAASARADVEINKYAFPTYKGKFVTHTNGLVVGSTINLTLSARGSLNQDYLIRSIQTSLRTPTAFTHAVSIETTDDLTMNDVLKRLLITNATDQLGTITDENVQRYIQIAEEITVTDTLSAPTKTSPPYLWDTAKWNLSTWA